MLCSVVCFISASNTQIKLVLFAQFDVFEAAERYQKEGIPLIILAGKDYGSGNSRDWVAKGPYLLVNLNFHVSFFMWCLPTCISPSLITFLTVVSSSPTGRTRGHCRELREAAQEPAGGHGHHAASVPARAEHWFSGAQREREVHHHDAWKPESQAAAYSEGTKPAAAKERVSFSYPFTTDCDRCHVFLQTSEGKSFLVTAMLDSEIDVIIFQHGGHLRYVARTFLWTWTPTWSSPTSCGDKLTAAPTPCESTAPLGKRKEKKNLTWAFEPDIIDIWTAPSSPSPLIGMMRGLAWDCLCVVPVDDWAPRTLLLSSRTRDKMKWILLASVYLT